MSFDVNTNISSLQAQGYLNKNTQFQAQTINEVTSGLRIVNSGDDAAGLAIANGYRSDQAVLSQGVRNANDGLSQLQIADGGISNISQLLDRARTLATQSASGTFTGSRDTLNSEFQSVIGEINRQAQAIGLNQGGSFAKNVSVFIGGGKSSGNISQVQNGSVAVNLSQSTVDAQSLGLQGVQAIGAVGTDIGPASSAGTSVSNIISNATNIASESNGGFTSFSFQGPGFGNNNPIDVSVNLTGVTDANTLVTAINTAIQNAGNGTTQEATAFKNAGVTASLNTDASGNTQLTFGSSNAAFQVEAGDRVSQALLGKFEQNATLTGTDKNATVATNGGGTSATLDLTIGTTSATPTVLAPITVTVGANTSKAQIVRDLNANTGFNAVATASLSGNQVVIKSNGNSANSSVAIGTTTTLSTALGLTGTAAAASTSTGADVNTQVLFNGPTAAGTTVFGTAGAGNVVLQFQGSGLVSPVNVTIATTATETVTQALTDLSSQVTNNASLKAAGITLTSATAADALAFTSTAGQPFNVGVTGDVQNLLGGGSFITGAGATFDYSTLVGAAAVSTGNAGTANFEFSINGAASNAVGASNLVSVNLSAGAHATSAAVTSTDTSAATVAITANNNQLNIIANGNSYIVNLNVNGAATKDDIAAQITAVTGADAVATVVGSAITLTSTTKGAGSSIQIQAGTANGTLGLATAAAAAPATGLSSSGADIAAALNTAFAANATLQAAGLTATYNAPGAANKITVTSNNGTFFRTDAYGTTAAAAVTGSNTGISVATAGSDLGSIAGPYAVVQATTDVLRVQVGVGGFQAITLNSGVARTAAQVASDINQQLVGATASVSGGALLITSNTTGAANGITIDTVGNGSTANTALGFGAGGVTGTTTAGAAAGTGYAVVTGSADTLAVTIDGHAASVLLGVTGAITSATLVSTINTALNTQLGTTGGVYASAVNDHIQIASLTTGNGSSVTIGSGNANAILGFTAGTTTGTQADLGFGVTGQTFINGNTATAAPATATQIDSGGANQTTSLAFTPIITGNGAQTVSINALDSSGATHSLSTLLQNNATNRSGQSIDSAIDSINTALQQSNDTTLQSIVAVKENVGGVQEIGFLSSTASFKVSIGTTAAGTGIGSQGTTDASAVTAGGGTANISTQAGALAAVSVLGNSVALLGSAQAVVGRGENQFNYAINLAQSQLTNLASAESQIRDADLAAEAANLTKAQILVQAGVAALAQANSAPQAVLSLLKG